MEAFGFWPGDVRFFRVWEPRKNRSPSRSPASPCRTPPKCSPRCRRQQTNARNKVYEPYTLKLKQQVLVVGSGLGVRPLAQIETAFQVDPALFLLYIYICVLLLGISGFRMLLKFSGGEGGFRRTQRNEQLLSIDLKVLVLAFV